MPTTDGWDHGAPPVRDLLKRLPIEAERLRDALESVALSATQPHGETGSHNVDIVESLVQLQLRLFMIFASGDPLNITLASAWSLVLLFCLWLTWYAYFRWKRNPNDSLSHRIALWAQNRGALIGFMLGMIVGVVAGMFLGLFAGHWFWPVVLQ